VFGGFAGVALLIAIVGVAGVLVVLLSVVAVWGQEKKAIVDPATEAAKASPASTSEVIERDVWADGGSSWRN
jgi:hypothetical protein